MHTQTSAKTTDAYAICYFTTRTHCTTSRSGASVYLARSVKVTWCHSRQIIRRHGDDVTTTKRETIRKGKNCATHWPTSRDYRSMQRWKKISTTDTFDRKTTEVQWHQWKEGEKERRCGFCNVFFQSRSEGRTDGLSPNFYKVSCMCLRTNPQLL